MEDVLVSGLSQMAAGTITRAQGFTKMKILLKVTKNLLEQFARDSITNGEIDVSYISYEINPLKFAIRYTFIAIDMLLHFTPHYPS